MRLCLATTSVPGDLPAKMNAIASAGFSGLELNEPDLIGFSGDAAEVGKLASSLGLTIDALLPFHDFAGLTGDARALAFRRLDQKLDLMQRLGAHTLLVGTSTHREASTKPDVIFSDYAELAQRARAAGCRAALVAQPWAQLHKRELDALELVEKVDDAGLGLALNSRFSLADGSQPARLRDIPGRRVFHAQLSDASMVTAGATAVKSHVGLLPGQGELNLASFVRVVARSGYDGPWSIAGVHDTAQGGHEYYTRDAYRALVSLLDDVSTTEPALQQPVQALPPRGYPSGFEFLEFAVDDDARQQLTATLSALCFRRERRHVSKSVELWRQGAVNLVVNSDNAGYAAKAFAEHGPTVCDMGLRVRDAANTVARASALGAPEFHQPVGTDELDIPAIRGVGGNIVHFIDEKSELHRVWDIEFDLVSKTEAIAPAGIRRIDHVAQTMRYQEMQSWLTYYTTTLEMEKAPIVDVADPSGVVLSQALSSPEGEVRLNLNGAGERRTFAGAFLADQFGAGVQHVAFLSDDIFETSERLARVGFRRLTIPDNYYLDLGARFGLDATFVAQLREGHILYDRDGGGEYLQIYGLPMFTGFFFEVVERRGGYDGYGARNAPIRLAAQNRYMKEGQPA
ncbi:bifunctional sugar phosphate isomerase/epimerase/4-hydroxyphenylpyruvate dioxygenase family protein [Aliiroseovarius sp. 2305UL8-7]|uniref:bifunctional sugar phosphate isomerase/epimerase/4-hydroxyphenylpyruvate dioxygenase family protein n=1 Tax=Aliiroseovarius conchicola TaxID=3121637 RepID=UPI0035280DDE